MSIVNHFSSKTSVHTEKPFYSIRNFIVTTLISVLYLSLCALLIGYKTEQLVLVLIFNICFYLSWGTRKFIIGFSVFIIFWILFDFMKAFPNYRFNQVHIEDIYDLDKRLFGIRAGGKLISLNEFWFAHAHTFLDLLSGCFYLCWMPVPLLFGIYLFYTNRPAYVQFGLIFLWVNLIGFVIYYLCPSSPPWYIQLHGFVFNAHTAGYTTMALAHFDAFFHVPVFKGLYSQSSNVFAAMPSLHAAYPSVVFYMAIKSRKKWFALVFFACVMLGIWFAAIYTGHHFLIDVIAGILVTIVGITTFEWLVSRRGTFHRFVEAYVRKVT